MVANTYECDLRNKDTPHSWGTGFVRNLKSKLFRHRGIISVFLHSWMTLAAPNGNPVWIPAGIFVTLLIKTNKSWTSSEAVELQKWKRIICSEYQWWKRDLRISNSVKFSQHYFVWFLRQWNLGNSSLNSTKVKKIHYKLKLSQDTAPGCENHSSGLEENHITKAETKRFKSITPCFCLDAGQVNHNGSTSLGSVNGVI